MKLGDKSDLYIVGARAGRFRLPSGRVVRVVEREVLDRALKACAPLMRASSERARESGRADFERLKREETLTKSGQTV